jgi:flagellar protein FliO/FliZ
MTEAALLRLAFSLVLIVLLLLALAWVARRSKWLRHATSQSGLKVVAMQNLGGRAALAIVEVQDARLVLGITAQQINLLHTLPPQPSEPGATVPVTTSPGFGSRLGAALKRR